MSGSFPTGIFNIAPQTLLGSLVLHHGQLTALIGTKPVLSGGTGDKASALLASGDSHWFSLLPVAAPPSHLKKQDKPVSTFDKKHVNVYLGVGSLGEDILGLWKNNFNFYSIKFLIGRSEINLINVKIKLIFA